MYKTFIEKKNILLICFALLLVLSAGLFFGLSSTKTASAADNEIHTEWYYAESAHSKGFAYNTGFSTNINNSSAVLSKTYYIEIAEKTYNQLDSGYNHLVVCWGRKAEMDILANHFKYDSEVGDPSFYGQPSFLQNSGVISGYHVDELQDYLIKNWWVYSDFPSYATFPCIAYRVQQSGIIDERSVGGCLWLPITVTWAEGSLFDIGIWLTYQYSTNPSQDTRINAYYTDSTIVSTVQSCVRIASSYSQDVAGAYEKALGIYRGGETDIVFSYLKPVQGHFNTAEQAQGTVRVPSVYVPDENYVKNQILQSNHANGRGLSGFNVEYNPTTAYSMTSGQVGYLDLLSPRIIRQATGINYGYSFGNSIPSTVNCPITYADYMYSNFYVKIENSKNPNEYVEGYFENDLQIDVYYTSYEEKNGRMFLYYDYDQIITLIGNTLHWSVQRDYFDLTISGSYDSSVVTIGDYVVNGENRGKFVSFPYSSSSERQSQNCLFGLEITGTAPITVPVELDWTVVYQVLNNDLTTSTATLSVGQYYDNEFGRLENEILDRNGTWANYVYGSLQPAILGGIEFMRPIDLVTGIGYINYDTLTATAFVEYAYNSAVLVINNNLNSDKWVVQLPDTISEYTLLNLGVKSKIPEGYRIGQIVNKDDGLVYREKDLGNPLNTTFYRVDSVRTEPYRMTVRLTDKWPVNITYYERFNNSPFFVKTVVEKQLLVADYDIFALTSDVVANILGKETLNLFELSMVERVNVDYNNQADTYYVTLDYSSASLKGKDYNGNDDEIKVPLTCYADWTASFGKDWSVMMLNDTANHYFKNTDGIKPDMLYGFFSVAVFRERVTDLNYWFQSYTANGCKTCFTSKEVKGSEIYEFFGNWDPVLGYPYMAFCELFNKNDAMYYSYFFYMDGSTDLAFLAINGADSYDDNDSAIKNKAQDIGESVGNFFSSLWDKIKNSTVFKIILIVLAVIVCIIVLSLVIKLVMLIFRRRN